MSDIRWNNPDLYRELSAPFESIDEANKNFTEFQDQLYELRKKHRIADLLFVAQVPVKYDDGEQGTPIVVGMFGDETKMEAITAYALGYAQSQRQERIARIMGESSRGVKNAQKRK